MNTNPLSQSDPWGNAPPTGNAQGGAPAAPSQPAPPAQPAPPPPAPPKAAFKVPPAEEFPAEMMYAACKRTMACLSAGTQIGSTCADLRAQSIGVTVTRDMVAAGYCTYDTAAAERCLKSIDALPCGANQQFDLGALQQMINDVASCGTAMVCRDP